MANKCTSQNHKHYSICGWLPRQQSSFTLSLTNPQCCSGINKGYTINYLSQQCQSHIPLPVTKHCLGLLKKAWKEETLWYHCCPLASYFRHCIITMWYLKLQQQSSNHEGRHHQLTEKGRVERSKHPGS